MTTRHTLVDTALGRLTLVARGGSLVGVYFPHHWTKPDRAGFGPAVDAGRDGVLDVARTQILEYLDGNRVTFELPTAPDGDAFQRSVWAMLEAIPYGARTTYGELAQRLGDRALAQSVGHAVGHNPISIVIPCHRVVGKDGKLTGYAGGLNRKKFLLDLEEPALVKAGRLF